MAEILPFAPSHAAGVPIQQQELGVAVTLQDQADLLDISGFYRCGAGNFWVALDGKAVVGTIALLDIGNRQAALRRMFVRTKYRDRTHAVAQGLLETLLAWSEGRGLREIFLGTTEQFVAAHRFYEKTDSAKSPKRICQRNFR